MNGTLKIKLGWFYNINSLALFFYIFIPEQSVSLMCRLEYILATTPENSYALAVILLKEVFYVYIYIIIPENSYASAVIILKDVFYTYKIIKKLLL